MERTTRRGRRNALELWDNRRPIVEQKPIVVECSRSLWNAIHRLVRQQGEVSLSIHKKYLKKEQRV